MRLMSLKSFTLVEMLLTTAIIAFALCGILAMYVSCFDLIATSKNTSIATNAAQTLMEQIRAHTFTDIVDDYDGNVYSASYLPANNKIFVYVDDADPELLRVTISVCWQQKNRVIGEDKNLNGVLNAGEDISPANNIIDSPVELVRLIANRS